MKIMAKWINAARGTNPARAGFYFFDTLNRLNPQGPGAPGTLAPNVKFNSSDDSNCCRMEGFVYMNVADSGPPASARPM